MLHLDTIPDDESMERDILGALKGNQLLKLDALAKAITGMRCAHLRRVKYTEMAVEQLIRKGKVKNVHGRYRLA